MKLTILGSASASPHPFRSSPAYLLEAGRKKILLDSGSGTAQKIKQAKYNLLDIDYFLYTHTHADHVSDLPYLLFTYRWQKRKKDLIIVGPKNFKSFVKTIEKTFAPNLEQLGKFKLKIIEVEDSSLKLGNLKITTKKMKHGSRYMYVPYDVGYRIEHNNKSIIYTGDTTYCKNVITLAKDADCLIIEGGRPEQDKNPVHLNTAGAAKIAQEANVKKFILTHIELKSEKYNLKKQAQKYFKGQIIVAKDLLNINI